MTIIVATIIPTVVAMTSAAVTMLLALSYWPCAILSAARVMVETERAAMP